MSTATATLQLLSAVRNRRAGYWFVKFRSDDRTTVVFVRPSELLNFEIFRLRVQRQCRLDVDLDDRDEWPSMVAGLLADPNRSYAP